MLADAVPQDRWAQLGDQVGDQVGNLRLHLLDFGGDGAPVVFLHATGFHAWLWLPYARRLADRFRVLAVDHRGHGESDKPATGYRWEEFGGDFARLLDVLDLDGVHAIGHSKGATAIAAAAAAGTRRLRSAVLIEPVLIAGPPATEPAWDAPLAAGARRRRNVWPSRDAMFEALRGKMPFETWQPELVRLYVDHGVRDRPDGQVELLCPPAIEAQVYAEAPMTDGFALLGHLAVPTLVVRGDRSPGLGERETAETLRRLRAGTVRTVARAGHFVAMERPAEVAAAIEGFDALA
ncbi:MAG TPA: alpha/beta hydrolase [Candidatus Binatia bacterium]|nr:alpha/beta hydrolase [Candidatus Binatia bacterium]